MVLKADGGCCKAVSKVKVMLLVKACVADHVFILSQLIHDCIVYHRHFLIAIFPGCGEGRCGAPPGQESILIRIV